MLETLRIKNLAIVENINVDFSDGLNVITGETGAGKSILMGALSLILGGRSDKNMIRTGEEKCNVEASFFLKKPETVNHILKEYGIELCEDGQLIIQKTLSVTGSSKNLINGCSATAQMLRKLGTILVDMHGPHDHQSLLNREFQMELLDSFAQTGKIKAEYAELYRKKLDIESELRALEGDNLQIEQQIDMLSYQVNEITSANLSEDDEEDLMAEHARVANAQQIIELTSGLNNLISENEMSAFNSIVQAQTLLNHLSPIMEEAKDWQKEIESISIQLQELSSAITSAAQTIDADPERMQWLDDRITLINSLKRKYGTSIADIIAFGENAAAKLHELQNREEIISKINDRLNTTVKELIKVGNKLHAARDKKAEKMAADITKELRELGFKHGVFTVQLKKGEPTASGMDEIEFCFAPNPGEDMRPLRAIASSGEISRVMLAIKTVLASHDKIPVMVFDEIDANVGGTTANAVGRKLAKVAEEHQVICITHLPQVAVHGDHHFVVEKQVVNKRTVTNIAPLAENDRPVEIARMLGGKDLTSVTMRHANEMLSAAKEDK